MPLFSGHGALNPGGPPHVNAKRLDAVKTNRMVAKVALSPSGPPGSPSQHGYGTQPNQGSPGHDLGA